MALPRKSQHQLKWALIFTLCFLTFATLPHKTVGRLINSDLQGKEKEEMKLVLGSKPPSCINKCMNCTPCMAVLVAPPHKKIHSSGQKSFSSLSSSPSEVTPQDEENYYLLAWKCKCKNRLFPP